jgi:hypothetical protein
MLSAINVTLLFDVGRALTEVEITARYTARDVPAKAE